MESCRELPPSVQPCRDATTVLLVRHAHTDAIGRRLTGRAPGIALSDAGRAQLPSLWNALAPYDIAAVYSSPLERALETARGIAERRGLTVRAHEGLNEVDFGAWTGLTFDRLAELEEWRRFNTHRATAPVPGGEPAAVVQARIVATLRTLHDAHAGGTIAVVSHADVIRAAVLHDAGVSLDDFERVEIAPASVATLSLSGEQGKVVALGQGAARCHCGICPHGVDLERV